MWQVYLHFSISTALQFLGVFIYSDPRTAQCCPLCDSSQTAVPSFYELVLQQRQVSWCGKKWKQLGCNDQNAFTAMSWPSSLDSFLHFVSTILRLRSHLCIPDHGGNRRDTARYFRISWNVFAMPLFLNSPPNEGHFCHDCRVTNRATIVAQIVCQDLVHTAFLEWREAHSNELKTLNQKKRKELRQLSLQIVQVWMEP